MIQSLLKDEHSDVESIKSNSDSTPKSEVLMASDSTKSSECYGSYYMINL